MRARHGWGRGYIANRKLNVYSFDGVTTLFQKLQQAVVLRRKIKVVGDSNNSQSADSVDRDADLSRLEPDAAGGGGEAGAAERHDEVVRLRAEAEEFRSKYLYALAESENIKKRALKERSDLLKYQGDRILEDFLEVLDSFERALESTGGDAARFEEGVRLIHRQLVDTFSRWDVRPAPGLGQHFDPERHRALSRVPAPGQPANTIIGELKKAYFYKDKLLRAGEVVVSAGDADEAASADAGTSGKSTDKTDG